jgi:hypothetical protein
VGQSAVKAGQIRTPLNKNAHLWAARFFLCLLCAEDSRTNVLHAHAARGGSIQVGAVRKLALFAQEHFARLALGNDSSGLVVLAYNTLRGGRVVRVSREDL